MCVCGVPERYENYTSFLSDLCVLSQRSLFLIFVSPETSGVKKISAVAKQKTQVRWFFVIRHYGQAVFYIINIYHVAMEEGMCTHWNIFIALQFLRMIFLRNADCKSVVILKKCTYDFAT